MEFLLARAPFPLIRGPSSQKDLISHRIRFKKLNKFNSLGKITALIKGFIPMESVENALNLWNNPFKKAVNYLGLYKEVSYYTSHLALKANDLMRFRYKIHETLLN